jgi:hypothetical protein
MIVRFTNSGNVAEHQLSFVAALAGMCYRNIEITPDVPLTLWQEIGRREWRIAVAGKDGGKWTTELRRIVEVAEKHGWNGAVLWAFLDDRLTELENESERRRGVIESQANALAEWRRKSDEDAGRLARYQTALTEISGRQVGLGEDAYIAFNHVKDRARAELGTEATGRAAGLGAATRPADGAEAHSASQGAKLPYPDGESR